MENLAQLKKFSVADNGCWMWNGYRDKRGYGRTSANGKSWLAHRLFYTCHRGEIPDGKVVMHSCDTPSCVNPEHLSAGTQRDNIHDCIHKGRENRARGAAKNKSSLTEDSIRAIRFAKKNTVATNRVLAAAFGVSQTAISNIHNNVTWSHVTDGY